MVDNISEFFSNASPQAAQSPLMRVSAVNVDHYINIIHNMGKHQYHIINYIT